MADAVERLLIVIDASTEQLRRELAKADKMVAESNSKMEKALSTMGKVWKGADGWVQRHSTQLKLLGAAAVGAMGLAIKSIAEYSDQYQLMQAQLKLVTTSQESLNAVWDESLRISNSTGASLESTVQLYTRMARASKELGLSQEELVGLTETISQAMAVSGASTEESSRAIVQFTQAVQEGTFRAQEFNSINEQAAYVLDVMAEGMGKTRGELRRMVVAGEVSAEDMLAAMQRMSGKVREEFSLIPETVERAFNKIRNTIATSIGKADITPFTNALNELQNLLSDPNITQGLTQLATDLVSVGTSAIEAASHLPEFVRWLRDLDQYGSKNLAETANSIALIEDELGRMNETERQKTERAKYLYEELDKLNKKYDEQVASINKVKDAKQQEEKAVEAVNSALQEENETKSEVVKVTSELAEKQSQLNDIVVTAKKRISEFTDAEWEAHDARMALKQSVEEYVEQVNFELAIMKESEREQYILNEMRRQGVDINSDLADKIREAAGAQYDANEAMRQGNEASEQLNSAMSGARNTLSDFFFEFARDGQNAFDTLVDGFKAMIAKMIAEAAASGIFKLFAGIAGGLGFSGVANAAAGAAGGNLLTSAIGGISGLFTGGGGGLQPIVTNVAQGLAPASGAAISAGASVGGAGFSAAGLATSLGIGAAVVGGGMILNKMFGEKNNGNNAGIANLNLASGTINASGSGKSFDQANVDRASQLAQELLNFATSIGGSNANLEVVYGNRSGAQLNGKKYGQDLDAFFADAFQIIIENATDLNGSLKALALGFKGTSEELMGFTSSMVSIEGMLKANPVDVAVKEFADAQKTASGSITQSYREQLIQIADLIRGYDGSSAATIELNAALVTNKQTAYQLTMQLQQMAETVTAMLLDSAQQIRDSQLTPEELKAQRVAEKTALRASLWTIQDPAELARVAGEIDRLNNLLFQSLSPDQQAGQAEAYAQYAERTAEIVQQRSERLIDKTRQTQEVLNNQIQGIYDDFGKNMRDVSDKFNMAADKILRAANRFDAYGGEVG